MANTSEFFLSVIQRIFSNWTGLKMSVEHGMGSNEVARNFCQYMAEVLSMNEKLDSTSLVNELEDYMESEFNTELQDNSSIEIAEELLRFHRYCTENNNNTAMSEFEKLPPTKAWIDMKLPKLMPTMPLQNDDDSSTSDEEGDKEMEDVEEGWTQVSSRRRK